MSDSTQHLDTLSSSQAGKEVTANALFDAASGAAFLGRRASTSSGLTWGYYGGKYFKTDGTIASLANGTVALTGSATNYVEFDPTAGTVSKNTTSFTAGRWPMYTVVCGASAVTSYTDHRGAIYPTFSRTTQAMADANQTLSADKARCPIIETTGALTAQRNLVVPLAPQQWTIFNNCTGFGIQVIGATGTGVVIAVGKRAIVYSDGTNVVRVTPDT